MSSSTTAVFETHLPLPNRRQGKVRDVYELPEAGPDALSALLIVASDRLSAFDVVMRTPVPGKGRLLTEMSRRWFDFIRENSLAETHVLSFEAGDLRAYGLSEDQIAELDGRVCIGRRCEVVPVECVVRGYLDGSGWKEYQQTRSVCGVSLPEGLQRGSRLPEPIFTPATKADLGEHDENIDFERACEIAGRGVMEHLRDTSLAIYNAAHEYASKRGVILADTKFEFGYPLGPDGSRSSERPIVVDEVLTPDSSRYWPADTWKPGGEQISYDKQFVRDYLQTLTDSGRWDKTAGPDGLGPELPENVVEGTLSRYREALDRLFG
jgi:phosphoribosylaminoimidazole-succinocarboxamide synthase